MTQSYVCANKCPRPQALLLQHQPWTLSLCTSSLSPLHSRQEFRTSSSQHLFTCLQQQPHYTLLQTSILQLSPPVLSQQMTTRLLLWERLVRLRCKERSEAVPVF